MGLIQRVSNLFTKRASATDSQFWGQFSQLVRLAASGKIVTPDTAMGQATVYACVKVRSETLASLPIFLYRRKPDGSRSIAKTHPLYAVLHEQPNPTMSKFDFWEYYQQNLDLRGNAYNWIQTDNAGNVIALWPLISDNMTYEIGVNEKGARRAVLYRYNVPETGNDIPFDPDEIWHSTDGIGPDGVGGVSRVGQVKNAIGAGLASDDYAGSFFANDATPSGILKYPGELDEDAAKDMLKSWNELQMGSGKAAKTALLQGGIEYAPIGMSNVDSQFIESRSFNVADIARIFRVPTILIGGAGNQDKSNTFASAEQQMSSWVTNTIRPMTVRVQDSISADLMTINERKKLFTEFKMEALLRGDLAARYTAYQIGLNNGFLSPDDVRRLENLDLIGQDGADTYVRPMNLEPLGGEQKGDDDVDVNPLAALNGAQVSSMVQIVEQVAAGIMPHETAIQIMFNSFPIDESTARAIIDPIEVKEPEPEPEPIQGKLPIEEEPEVDDGE